MNWRLCSTTCCCCCDVYVVTCMWTQYTLCCPWIDFTNHGHGTKHKILHGMPSCNVCDHIWMHQVQQCGEDYHSTSSICMTPFWNRNFKQKLIEFDTHSHRTFHNNSFQSSNILFAFYFQFSFCCLAEIPIERIGMPCSARIFICTPLSVRCKWSNSLIALRYLCCYFWAREIVRSATHLLLLRFVFIGQFVSAISLWKWNSLNFYFFLCSEPRNQNIREKILKYCTLQAHSLTRTHRPFEARNVKILLKLWSSGNHKQSTWQLC